jgi:hypothetical protein
MTLHMKAKNLGATPQQPFATTSATTAITVLKIQLPAHSVMMMRIELPVVSLRDANLCNTAKSTNMPPREREPFAVTPARNTTDVGPSQARLDFSEVGRGPSDVVLRATMTK